MAFVEILYEAAARAGLLVSAEVAGRTVSVGFLCLDENLLDGLVRSAAYTITYPLSQLPTLVQWVAKAAPLWHGVVVARAFTVGRVDWLAIAGHTAYICLWAAAGTVVATRRLRRKLYP